MSADADEDGQGEEVEKLREDGDVVVEAGIEDVGQRHAAHLADDLPGDLDAGEEDHHAESEQQADEGFVDEQMGVAAEVGDRRDGRVEVDGRHERAPW